MFLSNQRLEVKKEGASGFPWSGRAIRTFLLDVTCLFERAAAMITRTGDGPVCTMTARRPRAQTTMFANTNTGRSDRQIGARIVG